MADVRFLLEDFLRGYIYKEGLKTYQIPSLLIAGALARVALLMTSVLEIIKVRNDADGGARG